MRKTIAALLAGVVMFGLAGLYTGVLARDFIVSHVDQALLRAMPNYGLLVAGYLLLGAAMAWLYTRHAPNNGSVLWRGLRFGWAFGVLWLMPYSLVLFGVYRFPYEALPLDSAWALVEQGVGGIVIAFLLEPVRPAVHA